MTAMDKKPEAAVAASSEQSRRDLKGDITEVRKEILRGLSQVVTEAGHQGLMYVYDWRNASDRKVGEDALLNACICLDLAVDYVRQLREVHKQMQDTGSNDVWAAEVPF